MSAAASLGSRRALRAYIEDSTLTYTFDASHAILAYPTTLARLLSQGSIPPLDPSDLTHLDSLFSDRDGPFSFARDLSCRPQV